MNNGSDDKVRKYHEKAHDHDIWDFSDHVSCSLEIQFVYSDMLLCHSMMIRHLKDDASDVVRDSYINLKTMLCEHFYPSRCVYQV